MAIQKTASGKLIDMDAIRTKNETVIAVGNSKTNARGDLLGPGGKIVKTRDQIAADMYRQQKGTPLSNRPLTGDTTQQATPDVLPDPIKNDFEKVDLENAPVSEPTYEVINSGGVDDAVARSKELAEKLKATRSRI
jgi:hypothetical protein